MKTAIKHALTGIFLLLLAACGGGGGGGSALNSAMQANINDLQGTWVFASDGNHEGGACGLDVQGNLGKRLTMAISSTTYQSKIEDCIILSGNKGFYWETDSGSGSIRLGDIYLYQQDSSINLRAIDFISNQTNYTAYRVQDSTLYLSDSSRLRDGLTPETRAYNNLLAFTKINVAGGSDGGGVNAANNPLAKYAGTYYICDGHSKETVTVAASGSNSISLTYVEDVYQNNNCTGSIVGTYRMPQAVTATYQNQTTANFPPVTILPAADTVDRVTLSSPGMTAQLTGSGVSGSCVNYADGNVCYDNLVLPAVSTTGAVYLSGNYLMTFILQNGVLEADGIYSKDASFNYNMLIPD